MTAKKQVKSKLISAKNNFADLKKISSNYKSVFDKPIIIKRVIKRDANYYGIKQKLKNYAGLDLFRKLKEDKPKKEEKFKKENFLFICWAEYCKWWNEVINHERR